MSDLNQEALSIWNALKPVIDKEIAAKTQGMVQRRKAKVTTAPSLVTNTIGVTEAFGSEMFLPFVTNLASAVVGDLVWVEWMYGPSNAFVSAFASMDERDFCVSGNLTVLGNTDSLQLHCNGTLSSVGWYRAFKLSYTSGSALSIDIGVNTTYAKKIDLLFPSVAGAKFLNEVSTGSGNGIDKIRLWGVGGTTQECYLDIHVNSNDGFTVYMNAMPSGNFTNTCESKGLVGVSATPSEGSLVTEYSFSENNGPVYGCNASNLVTSGSITNTGLSYTATQRCWFFLSAVIKAVSSGGLTVKLNNVSIISYTSGEAIGPNYAFIPIPMQTGDTLEVTPNSTESFNYYVFGMK